MNVSMVVDRCHGHTTQSFGLLYQLSAIVVIALIVKFVRFYNLRIVS